MNKSNILKTLQAIVACYVSGLGVGMIIHYNFGVDPLSLFQIGLSNVSGLSIGTVALIYNLILLSFSFLVNRKQLGMGTVVYTITLGVFMDYSIAIMPDLPQLPSLFLFFLGHLILCIGNAMLIYLDFGLSSLDAIIQWVTSRTKIRYGFIKVSTDILFTLLGYILGVTMNWGSLYIMITTGFIVDFLVERFARCVPSRKDRCRS